MKVFIVNNQLSEVEYAKIIDISYCNKPDNKPIEELRELGFLIEKDADKNSNYEFSLGKLFSYEGNNYVLKSKIYNYNLETIGYLFINIETNYDNLKKKEEKHNCPKCGDFFSTEVPFGELNSNQLNKIENRDNVKACHNCFLVKENDKTIKQSQVFKLKVV